MYKLLTAIVFTGILAGLAAGCRSTKKIQKMVATPIPRKDSVTLRPPTVEAEKPRDLHADSMAFIRQTLGQLQTHRVDFRTFSGHMKVHYEEGDGKDYDLNAFIHIKKDSIIWVSVNAALGIEAFRMLITPDSVKIVDRLKHIVRFRSVSFLQEAVHLPLDFKTLQDLLIGNPIFLDTTRILFYKKDAKGVSLFSAGSFFRNFLTLNPDATLQHSKLDDTDPLRARTGDMTYGEYEGAEGTRFSTYRKISVAEKLKVDIEIGFKQYKFNDVLSYSFPVPKNYKRK